MSNSMCFLRFACMLLVSIVAAAVDGQVVKSSSNINSDTGEFKSSSSSRQPDDYTAIRLTNDASESVNPRVVADAAFLYVTWEDTRDGNREIYWQKFVRSSGIPATTAIRITNSGESSIEPVIGIDAAGNSYIAWQEGTLYNSIWAAKIGPSGDILVNPVTVLSGLYQDPDIAVSSTGDNVIVAHLMTASNQSVYVRRGNASMGQNCIVQLPGAFLSVEKHPAVAFDGTNSYTSFREFELFSDRMYTYQINGTCGGGKVLQIDATPIIACTDNGASGLWVGYSRGGNVYDMLASNSSAQVNDVAGTAGTARVASSSPHGYYVWQDSRHGNPEIYMSEASNPVQPYTDVRLTSHTASQQNPDIACSATEPGTWWVVWQDNRDGNWEIYMTSSANTNSPVTLVVKAGDGTPILTQDAVVTQLRIIGASWSEINERTTTISGTVTFDNLLPGDALFARRLLDNQQLQSSDPIFRDGRTWKNWHKQLGGVNYTFFTYDENTNSDLTYEVYSAGQTEIHLDHRLARMNLIAGFDYDVGTPEAETMKLHLTEAARRFYNVTNGQFWIDSVTIVDRIEDANSEDPNGVFQNVDIRINRAREIPGTSCLPFPLGEVNGPAVHAPQPDWDEPIPNLSDPSLAIFYTYLPFRVPKYHLGYDKEMFDDISQGSSFSRTLHHELGHYVFMLGDETHKDDILSTLDCLDSWTCANNIESEHACIMTYTGDNQELIQGINSEFCHSENHVAANCMKMSDFWTSDYSCWDAIKFVYPWIHEVTTGTEADFGPTTTETPKFVVDATLPTMNTIARRVFIHRPEFRRAMQERIQLSIRRSSRELLSGEFSFDREQLVLQLPGSIDLREGDQIFVYADGYAVNWFTILGGTGQVVDLHLGASATVEEYWNYFGNKVGRPNETRVHITGGIGKQIHSNADEIGIDFQWTHPIDGRDLAVSICRPDSSCVEYPLIPLTDTLDVGLISISSEPSGPITYIVHSVGAPPDSVNALGRIVHVVGESIRGASLVLPGISDLFVPAANFTVPHSVIMASAADIVIVDSLASDGLASPVIVDCQGLSSMWGSPGTIYFHSDEFMFDTSATAICVYQSGSWQKLPTVFDTVMHRWGALVPGNGLYALVSNGSTPSNLQVVYPSDYTIFTPGATDQVSWTTSGGYDSLVVRMSLDSGTTYPLLIYRDTVPSSGFLNWLVPTVICRDARLAVTLFDAMGSQTDHVIGLSISCCIGTTGNVDKSGAEPPDLSDLSLLIAYLTQTQRPVLPCPDEGNVNAVGEIDLSDLSLLIAYLTQVQRPVLPSCG